MTPERQKWWNELPAEEKQVRRSIEWQQEIIAYNKALMNDEITCDYGYLKKQNREAKHAIKALRKEIAMDVIALHNSAYEYYTCPYCGQNVKEGDVTRDEDNYCASCGQKLRWE